VLAVFVHTRNAVRSRPIIVPSVNKKRPSLILLEAGNVYFEFILITHC
jgi:hypothetical protein